MPLYFFISLLLKENFTEGRILVSGALKPKAGKEEKKRKLNERLIVWRRDGDESQLNNLVLSRVLSSILVQNLLCTSMSRMLTSWVSNT